MRSLKLFAVLCVFASSAYSQNIVVGVNGGMAANRCWKKNVGFDKIFEAGLDTNPIGTFRFGVTMKNIELGALFSLSRFSYQIDSRTNPAKTWFEPWQYPFTGYDTYVLGERTITAQFYLTRKFNFGNFQPYIGGAMGQGRCYIYKPMNERSDKNTDVFYSQADTKTFNFTGQAGLTYKIAKQIAVNTEVMATCILLTNPFTARTQVYYSIPVTLGIRYTVL